MAVPRPTTEPKRPADSATGAGRGRFSLRGREILWWARWAYIAAFLAVLLYRRAFWTPDALFIFLIGLFTLLGQGKKFIHDFSPFIVLLLVYDSLRGLAHSLHGRVHFSEMINFDQWVGGLDLDKTAARILALRDVSYAGFLTFVLFPAAPPWLASQMGMISEIARLRDDIWEAFGAHGLPSIYVYLLHFVAPIGLAVLIWTKRAAVLRVHVPPSRMAQ